MTSTIYDLTPSGQGVWPRALFIWKKLAAGERLRRRAHFSISIYIPTSAPHAAVHLSLMLVHFLHHVTTAFVLADYYFDPNNLPRIVDLAYWLTPTAIYVLAYCNDLDASYNDARAEPRNASRLFSVTSSPPNDLDLLHSSNIQFLDHITRRLAIV